MVRSLAGAHRGYLYQDLMCAGRLVDVLLETVATVLIDRKLFTGDRFDDLTATWANGLRERVQIKHRAEPGPFSVDDLTTDARSLGLLELVTSAITDRDGPGMSSRDFLFRILLSDQRPTTDDSGAVFRPADPDPGGFLPGMRTQRYRLDADSIWPDPTEPGDAPASWAFLRDSPITQSDLRWFCDHAIFEFDAPSSSFELTSPSEADELVLGRAVKDIGAGTYPNQHRSPVDVVAALIGAAAAARAGGDRSDSVMRS